MKISINDIFPCFYGIQHFRYSPFDKNIIKIDGKKSQYLYRMICITDGNLTVELDGKRFNCKPGNIIYLVPGSQYRLLPDNNNFSLVNIFFDYLPKSENSQTLYSPQCVFIENFKPELCKAPIIFSETDILNSSHVFIHSGYSAIIEQLCSVNKDNPIFELYAKAKLAELIFCINQNSRDKCNNTVDKIIAYINSHPTDKISASELEKQFGYHRNYINSLIKHYTGKTLTEYIRKVKIEYAVMLLTITNASPTQVAEKLGYYDYSHFYKAYFAETGKVPSNLNKSQS